jgi:multiple sugar transport system permease protein
VFKDQAVVKRRQSPTSIAFETLRWIVFAVVVLLINFPLIATAFTSFKPIADIYKNPPVWVFSPTLKYYGIVLSDPTLNFPRYLLNSVVIATLGTVIAIVLTLPAAYAMVRFRIGSRTLLPLITNLRAVPLVIFAIPFYLMFQAVGLLDTHLGLGLIGAIINIPLALILFVGFVQDFPLEVEEAARVDGANTWAVFRFVIVPLARPAITATAILSFIYVWNEFLFGLILTTRNATPVTVGATLFITSWGVKWGEISAAMVLSTLPPLVIGLLSYRQLARALTAGAIKG